MIIHSALIRLWPQFQPLTCPVLSLGSTLEVNDSGVVFVMDAGRSQVVKLTSALEPMEVIYIAGIGEGTCVALAPGDTSGTMYISDELYADVVVVSSDGTVLTSFNDYYNFGLPTCLTVDNNGTIWVSDAFLGQVIGLSISTGEQLAAFSCCGVPNDVRVDNITGDLYVSDPAGPAVYQLDGVTGVTLATYSVGLAKPVGLALIPNISFWVADDGTNKIEQFSTRTSAVLTDIAGFDNLYGVAIDAKGRAHVVDHGNNRVVVLNQTSGDFIAVYNNSAFQNIWGIAVSRMINFILYIQQLCVHTPLAGGHPISINVLC